MTTASDAQIHFLRHTLATLAYRCGKAIRDAPEEFATFRAGPTSRTPIQILAHVGDLLDWAISIVNGRQVWNETEPGLWRDQVERFHATLATLDGDLSKSGEAVPAERLFQGPIADALCHTGQLALLRRLAGAPIKGENFYKARIETGVVGPEQAPPAREFG